MARQRRDSGQQFALNEAFPAKLGGLFDTEDGQVTLHDGIGTKYWFIDTTGGNVTVTLPAANGSAPSRFVVKRLTAGVNTLTVATDGGNIDGSATHSVPTQYQCFHYASDGNNYSIIATFP